MQMEIVSYTYRNVDIHTAAHTHRMHLDELIVYIMGEKLMLGVTGECELNGVLLGYLHSTLDILDKPNVEIIYAEIRKRVEELSTNLTYQSLLCSGEFYLKYDYHVSKQFTKIQLYVDPSETAWTLW
jgi:hypothetical protein